MSNTLASSESITTWASFLTALSAPDVWTFRRMFDSNWATVFLDEWI